MATEPPSIDQLVVLFPALGATTRVTWMSQEVSKRLGSVGYNPNTPHLYLSRL